MRRRDFVRLLGGVAGAWPLVAGAQQVAMPALGFLHASSPTANALAAFRQGLSEAGYMEGRNVTIEYRFAEGDYGRLLDLAGELVARRVDVIVTGGGAAPAQAAKALTSAIPIVFAATADPVGAGLVASLSRPAANLTGIAALTSELDGKRLELLREVMPNRGVIGLLVNPRRSGADMQARDVQTAARSLGQEVVILPAATEPDIEVVFASLARVGVEGLVVGADPFFNTQRERLVALAARHRVPAIYQWREFVAAGGLMGYGASLPDTYRQTGIYAGRILQGTKPADLPVLQPTTFEFAVNLKTARALGLEIPPALLARADEVIE